jgi:hypothetical protein
MDRRGRIRHARRRSLAPPVIAAFAAALFTATLLAGCSPSGSSPGSSAGSPSGSSPGSAAGPIPRFSHIYLLLMENRGYNQVVSSPEAPYLASLIGRAGLATNYDAIFEGSLPNYLALFSGSTHGITDSNLYDISAPNLADQIEAAGLTWRVFAENVPLGCYLGAYASGGPDGSGVYARKHEPAISFTDISSNPRRCGMISDFSHFDPSAADFELIVPNLCHQMHDCSTKQGDDFLAGFVPRIMAAPTWSTSLLIITFDEGNHAPPRPDRVATILVSSAVRPGLRSGVHHSHYSLLQTIELAWGLPCLAQSCGAGDLREFFATK